MNAIFARAGLAALALGIAVPAHAGVSEDFSECDGLKKPKSSDDGMRGEATFPSYRFSGRDAPSRTLAACNRALESGKLLPEQTLRRAHVMRARAAAKLELGMPPVRSPISMPPKRQVRPTLAISSMIAAWASRSICCAPLP